jgi:hypothetical protein
MKTKSDTILDVSLHALENLASNLDGEDDSRKTWSKEDNVGRGLGGFRSTLDSDTAVSLLERWRIVDT